MDEQEKARRAELLAEAESSAFEEAIAAQTFQQVMAVVAEMPGASASPSLAGVLLAGALLARMEYRGKVMPNGKVVGLAEYQSRKAFLEACGQQYDKSYPIYVEHQRQMAAATAEAVGGDVTAQGLAILQAPDPETPTN
jgi:hypothetical protein